MVFSLSYIPPLKAKISLELVLGESRYAERDRHLKLFAVCALTDFVDSNTMRLRNTLKTFKRALRA